MSPLVGLRGCDGVWSVPLVRCAGIPAKYRLSASVGSSFVSLLWFVRAMLRGTCWWLVRAAFSSRWISWCCRSPSLRVRADSRVSAFSSASAAFLLFVRP